MRVLCASPTVKSMQSRFWLDASVLHAARSGEQVKKVTQLRCALIAGFGANTAIEMSLGELPAAVLDVVVQSAGEEHGWRLEVASPALRATSMECCAIRLGKCRWTAGDSAGTEFRPCWRHVAVALRRGPYYVLRHGGNGPAHMRFQFPSAGRLDYGYGHLLRVRMSAFFVQRGQADIFAIEPTGNGEGIVYDHQSGRYKFLVERSDQIRPPLSSCRAKLQVVDITTTGLKGLAMMPNQFSDASTPWLLHLGSHASHLPFRRCRMPGTGSIKRVLRAWNDQVGVLSDITHWELAPATLADDERFEWRV